MGNRWLTWVAPGVLVLALWGTAAGADSALETAMTEFQLVRMGSEAPPSFALETLDGKTLHPGDLKGKAVLLYFWATW